MIVHSLPQPLANVLYSSRRRSRTGPSKSQTTLPDWVWGAGIGVLVLIFVGGYFLITQVSGGSGNSCDQALKPLGNSQVDEAAFADQDEGLGRVINLLRAGDRAGAEAAFFGPVHNFTHNVDPPLREQNEALAKQLCEQVIAVENGLTERGPDAEIAATVERIREILRDAAESLGYQRPGDAAGYRLEGHKSRRG